MCKRRMIIVLFTVIMLICGACGRRGDGFSGPNAEIEAGEAFSMPRSGWASNYDWDSPYTDYISDTATVTAIVKSLPYPEGYQYDHIEIQSSEEPYGLTVFLQGNSSVDMNMIIEASNKVFESIGNLGSITFKSIDSGEIATIFAHEEIVTEHLDTDPLVYDRENTTTHYYSLDEDSRAGE